MKNALIILPLILLFQTVFSEENNTEIAPPKAPLTLIVEMNGFDFRGDFYWLRFEKGMEKAFQEAELPYELKFESFPIKDYKGNPTIEIRLKFWDAWRLGKRSLNFWARYIEPDNTKHKWHVINCEHIPMGVSETIIEQNYEEHAFKAANELISILNTEW